MTRSLISSREMMLVRTLAALLLVFGVGGQALAQAPQAEAPTETQAGEALVYRIPVTGVIEMGLAPFIERSLREAAASGAQAAILDIDTPGGRVDAAERIVDAVGDAGIPVYAFVNRRAFSAGALIALSTNRIYMRPGSTMGAATPVTGEGQKAPEKIVSAMRSEFRALAEERGLDPRVAEAMVDEDIEIAGVVEKGRLLTLSTGEAVNLGYAAEIESWDALLAELGAAQATVVESRTNWAERLVRFFTNPIVAPFLLSIGFLGLMIEIKTPGMGLPGLAGATSLGLFFGSHLIIGLAGWEVLMLLAGGILLLLAEAFVFPGFGVAGILGVLAVLASIFLSLIGSMPTSGDIMVALNVIAASLVIVGVVGWQLMRHLPKDRRARRIMLETSTSREAGYISGDMRDELVGTEGVAVTDLRPAGTGQFGEEMVDVVSEGGWVVAGTPIRVLRADGYRQVVRPVVARSA
ncbi:MAG: nodulation protein NfeD [Gemmatimonadetes bacterium]|nr:nodulation protein NfeD [Gemmatimonadota bacterium]